MNFYNIFFPLEYHKAQETLDQPDSRWQRADGDVIMCKFDASACNAFL